MAPFAQDGVTFGSILDASMNGFVCESEIESLNDLLSTGGLMNMSSSILMTMIAMMFGGIMEGTGQLAVLINAIAKHIKRDAGLIGATEATCILSNIVMPEQYISILVPGRMYAPAYRKAGLHPKCLSNALESSGTVTSCLVPWNTCGIYCLTVLGISAMEYATCAYFNLICIVVVILWGFIASRRIVQKAKESEFGEA
jgi:NhaC family Na+:H+ antiporter